MNEFSQFFSTPTGLGLTIALVIFLITIILVSFRVIGFWITLLLLLFSLLTGVTIANNDALRDYLKCKKQEEEMEKYDIFSKQILKAYDQMKEELEEQNNELQELFDHLKQKLDQKQKPSPVEEEV